MNSSASAFFWFALLFSILLSLVTLVVLALIVLRLPSDRFCSARLHRKSADVSLRRLAEQTLNNLSGLVVIVVGVLLALPAVPGPGTLVVLLGILLLDFRQKPRFERWLITRFGLLTIINRFRRYCRREPFHLE